MEGKEDHINKDQDCCKSTNTHLSPAWISNSVKKLQTVSSIACTLGSGRTSPVAHTDTLGETDAQVMRNCLS